MRTTVGRRSGAVAITLCAALLLAACGDDGDDDESSGGGGGGDCEAAGEAVELDFVSWVPGVDAAVDLWNSENPDIQVNLTTGPSGNAGTYQDFFNALEAGNAPDLGQIEFDTLPNFRVQDGLTNIAACENVTDSQDQFIDWTWEQVTFGEDDSVYAIPQDTGPMAMYYRADLFEAAGIAVPQTWEEFATAAAEVRQSGAYITHFPQRDVNWFAGLVWQNEGEWFANDGEAWDVQLTSDPSLTVANYWQELIQNDLVANLQGFSEEWNAALDNGSVWTWISAVWGNNTISTNAPSTAGKWRVVQMPQWQAGSSAAGNWGGSTTAVFSDSEHPYEAAQFALWLNTNEDSLTLLNQEGGLYPATTAGVSLPSLTAGLPFYGDEPIFDVFAEAGANVNPDFTWGPTMTQTYNDIGDGFGEALSGGGTLADALTAAQETTISTLESQSIPVNS